MHKTTPYLLVFAVALPLFILLFSYKTSLYLFPKTDAQLETLNFLQKDVPLSLVYTSPELSHLHDVKSVMRWINYVFYLSALILLGILYAFWKNKPVLRNLFRYGGISTFGSIGFFLLLAFFRFNLLFTLFHQLFFPQGNWQFPEDSLLIQTFPLEFFVKVSLLIFGVSLWLGVMVMLLSRVITKGL